MSSEIFTENEAYNALVKYIKDNGGRFTDWYCGVTHDVPTRLDQHENEKGITAKLPGKVKCSSMKIAIAVEAKMHAKDCLGHARGPGGVNDNSKYVYVFKK
ncbi:MAG: hypothetical protein ACNYPD_06885 [Candidatus Halichondribacter symbioticus]